MTKRLARLISYIQHTREIKQYCHVGSTAQQCGLGLFQDNDFAGDLEDPKSASGGVLCNFGSHTFVPIVGRARNKHLSHTVQRNLRLFVLMQVYAAWDPSSRSLGIWSSNVPFFP